MKVGEVMTRYVEFLETGATVQEAATMMGELDVGALPVGSAAELEGVITDRDILFRVVAAGLDPSRTPVMDILSRPLISCTDTDDVAAVMDIMAGHHIRRMPVRAGDGSIAGWITLSDLSRRLLIDSGKLQTALQEIGAAA